MGWVVGQLIPRRYGLRGRSCVDGQVSRDRNDWLVAFQAKIGPTVG